MKKKTILINIALMLLLFSLVFGLTGSTDTFADQTNPFNVTFTESGNQTYYIEIPIYADIESISIDIRGLSIS